MRTFTCQELAGYGFIAFLEKKLTDFPYRFSDCYGYDPRFNIETIEDAIEVLDESGRLVDEFPPDDCDDAYMVEQAGRFMDWIHVDEPFTSKEKAIQDFESQIWTNQYRGKLSEDDVNYILDNPDNFMLLYPGWFRPFDMTPNDSDLLEAVASAPIEDAIDFIVEADLEVARDREWYLKWRTDWDSQLDAFEGGVPVEDIFA